MSLWKVRVDVITQENGKPAQRHSRWHLVEARCDEDAEAVAKRIATMFNFGPRIVAVEWRSTTSVSLPFDLTQWEQEKRKELP